MIAKVFLKIKSVPVFSTGTLFFLSSARLFACRAVYSYCVT